MRTAPVAKLKASLSEYLRHVKAGDEVVVTERGRPIAKLSPITALEISGHLAAMASDGRIKLGTGRLAKRFWRLPRPKDPKGLVLRSLLAERDSGR